jgi:hypothetical protein
MRRLAGAAVSSLSERQPLRSADLDADGLEFLYPLARARRTQGRTGRWAGLALFIRLGDADIWRQAQGLPCARRDIVGATDRGPVPTVSPGGCRRPGRRSRARAGRTTRPKRSRKPSS